ncbi:transglycosylase family protein [Kitasatospora purpeofusca]|uniref:transglycosylase family protein n=1 Tax=Kitasatospora purpeofusca TaxID=67352 RepID=UPI00364F1728
MPIERRISSAGVGIALLSSALVFTSAGTAGAASVATWDKVAKCESGGNWSIVSSNGLYYGGLQVNLHNWRYYGGLQYAARPDLASKRQQILIAEKILADQGAGAWTCAPGTGLSIDHANPYPDPLTTEVFSIGDDDIIYGADGDCNTGNWTRFWALPDNAGTKRIATASN